jgi:alpha-amylase/alpha-mannosidase (GH57 family)
MTEKNKKFFCLHGHFYQPPRENPWLEEIEIQDSAFPYQNWNERITAECYAPNSASRILDDKGNIRDIVNNYSKMSFNFGPTLLVWLERFAPGVHEAILEADKMSLKQFSGHGAALAQAYNHMILPLCNDRDRRTQIAWGIADFESRFKRKPEGMWLPETAVDTASLEVLAEMGIKFTILAPRQAKRFRKIGDKSWTTLKDANIDPQRPYLCQLPSGQSIALLFL